MSLLCLWVYTIRYNRHTAKLLGDGACPNYFSVCLGLGLGLGLGLELGLGLG